jgi:CxxC motif-containing protein
MKKQITCIECPAGCLLEVNVQEGAMEEVKGNKCEKGYAYAQKEVTSPERFLTSTVASEGLEMKRVPVRTNRPVPKERISDIMDVIRRKRIERPVKAGDVLEANVLGLGANIVATRSVDLKGR